MPVKSRGTACFAVSNIVDGRSDSTPQNAFRDTPTSSESTNTSGSEESSGDTAGPSGSMSALDVAMQPVPPPLAVTRSVEQASAHSV